MRVANFRVILSLAGAGLGEKRLLPLCVTVHCDPGVFQVHAPWMQMTVLSFLSCLLLFLSVSVEDSESFIATQSQGSEMAE